MCEVRVTSIGKGIGTDNLFTLYKNYLPESRIL